MCVLSPCSLPSLFFLEVFLGLGVGEGRGGEVVVQLRGVLPSASLRPSPSFFPRPISSSVCVSSQRRSVCES